MSAIRYHFVLSLQVQTDRGPAQTTWTDTVALGPRTPSEVFTQLSAALVAQIPGADTSVVPICLCWSLMPDTPLGGAR
ncbi:hypothetical protein AB0D56_37950 [Streptomyces sp. NPDC048209]|uniref:hypothetical protein n=1 Tax=Streptomyces sp. NPDC048209 TaxID=3156689 RepID=UPI00341BCE90